MCGVGPRPGVAAGTPCAADRCSKTLSSSWSKGVCAGCRAKAARKAKAKKAAGVPLADVTNAKRSRSEADQQGAAAMNYGLALPAAAGPVGGEEPHQAFDEHWAAQAAADELVAQAVNEQSAIEQKLRAELSELQGQLAAERVLAQRLTRRVTEVDR